MPLIDDPGVTGSLMTPRGYIPLPGSDEETHPAVPPPVAPTTLDKISSFFHESEPGEGAVFMPGLGIVGGKPNADQLVERAAVRQSNGIASAIARFQDTYGVTNDLVDPTYSPWTDVAGTPYEQYWKSTFVRSNNHKYTEALKRSIDRQEADKRTVDAGGALGVVAGIAAGAIDPTMLLPVGGQINLARKGVWTLAKGAMHGAVAGGVATSAYELGLQASQDTRTTGESLTNIGTGIVLGATIGGVIAGALSRTQRVGSERALEHLPYASLYPGDAGAATLHHFSLDDLTINGGITRNIAAGTAFSPNMRGNFRESPLARQTYQELATNVFRQQMHLQGLTLGPSVETNIGVSLGETIGQAMTKHPNIFAEGKKAGFGLSTNQFDEAVGQAMRRSDVGKNDWVSKAAQMWRGQVIEPLTKQAIDLRLLPEDVSVTEAPSYFSRMYNKEKMIARKPEFILTASEHFHSVLQQQFAKDSVKLQTRQAAIAEELGHLRLSPEDRLKKLEALKAQHTALEGQFHQEAGIADEVRNLRAVAAKARATGDTAGEQAAKQQIEALHANAGEDYQTFRAEAAKLKKTARQVNLGYAGMQEKADSLLQKLTDLSAQNFKNLQRLIARGQKLAVELKKLNPEDLQTKIKDLHSQFYGLVTKSEAAQDRLAKQIETLRGDEDKKVQSALAEAGLNKEKLNKTETKKAAKIEKQVRAENTAIADRLEKGLGEEKSRTERISKVSDRLEAAQGVDNAGDLAEVNHAVDSLTLEVSNKSLGKGERGAELLSRLAKLDPKKIDERAASLEQLHKDMEREFYSKWETRRLGENVDLTDPKNIPDFSAHAKDMAHEVFDAIVGHDYGSASVDPQFHLAARSGPLKDRTFHIPDEKVEPFLEDNVVKVMSRFSRQMAAQIELARKFPDDPLLKKRFLDIKNEYDALTNAATTEAERNKLDKDMRGTMRDLRAFIEIHRGSYKAAENGSSQGRIVRGLMQFNYIRSMGGAAIPSLADVYGPAIFHPLQTMQVGIPALIKAVSKHGGLIREAHLAGVAERLGHYRLQTWTEIGDPYGGGTAIERMLDSGTRLGSKLNGLNMLTDFEKDFNSIIVQHRLNTAILEDKAKEIPFLAESGISSEMKVRIKKLLEEHGTTEDGITVANTDQWKDNFDAVRAYRAAIHFNVNTNIVTRGIGDVPLAAYHPLGKMFLQFKTFNLAAHQRMFLRSMQLGPAQFMSGLIGLTTIGMFATTLKAIRGGKDNWDRFKAIGDPSSPTFNPGYLLGEGLDQTGFFTLPIELGNEAEAATAQAGYGVNPAKFPLMLAGRAINPDASMGASSQRYATKSFVDALAGPTIGFVGDVATGPGGIIVDKAQGKDISKAHRNAANRVVPYQSYYGMREAMQVLEKNSPWLDDSNE